jgi:AcrR family transcriptional regulator
MAPRTTTRRRTPQQARSKEKVEAILRAARELLIADGPAGFNTNRIAKQAGVGVGSLYEYFPNKQAIISRLIDDTATAESDAVLATLDATDDQPLEAIIGPLVDQVCELYRANAPLYRMLWAMSSEAREVGSRPAERAIVRAMQERLAARADELAIDDPKLAAFTAFHMVESLASRMAEQGGAWTPALRSREIARAVTRYLKLA